MLNKGQVPPGYPYYGNVPPGAQQYQVPMPAHLGGVPGSIPGQPAYVPDQGYPQQPGTLSFLYTVELGNKEHLVTLKLFLYAKFPYPYEVMWQLVTENGSLAPI